MKQSAVKKSRTDLSRGKSRTKGNTTGQRAEQGETQQDKQQDKVEQSKILGREENKRAKKKKSQAENILSDESIYMHAFNSIQ